MKKNTGGKMTTLEQRYSHIWGDKFRVYYSDGSSEKFNCEFGKDQLFSSLVGEKRKIIKIEDI